MSRLIDADALIEEVKSLQVSLTGLRTGKGILTEYEKQYRESVLRIINEQPTAYDEKLVEEQLKEVSEVFCKEYSKPEGSLYLQDAIDIVKRGGVE